MNFLPLALPFILALFLILIVVAAFVEIGILSYAYERIGVSPRFVMLFLLLTLIGSAINVPIGEIHGRTAVGGRQVSVFGMRYVVPHVAWDHTILAVNLGGAVLPTLLSLYLLWKTGLWVRGAIAVVVVAAAVHALARPVEGIGIAVPMFVPPLLAAATALFLAPRGTAPAIAYVAGSLGTLVGADLMNLGVIGSLGAPIASIGGAGRFDGIFLTGILAALLA
ncbi:MAG: hypothetical protein B6D46_09100 [Polyangiaceae bacterium UTPRO1]|jgi:uncharacterized membrane protein|nr:DUF1614 domain-containing protein [Myxococcales bacterium]OQY66881.1 MAG: hypothetical protein B6D46_09100 [Polyangiaceae bacterium UTPRO1]